MRNCGKVSNSRRPRQAQERRVQGAALGAKGRGVGAGQAGSRARTPQPGWPPEGERLGQKLTGLPWDSPLLMCEFLGERGMGVKQCHCPSTLGVHFPLCPWENTKTYPQSL